MYSYSIQVKEVEILGAIEIIMAGLAAAFVCCMCDSNLKVLVGIALVCGLELLIIIAGEYSHFQTYTTSHFGTCYVDWAGNKVYINEEDNHIRIVNYNTPNEVINYYTLDKGDKTIEK